MKIILGLYRSTVFYYIILTFRKVIKLYSSSDDEEFF